MCTSSTQTETSSSTPQTETKSPPVEQKSTETETSSSTPQTENESPSVEQESTQTETSSPTPQTETKSPPVEESPRSVTLLLPDDMDDPHEIEARFLPQHEKHFDNAMREIGNGKRETEWTWFLLPITPVIVQNVEQGCANTRTYALSGDDAIKAYLTSRNGMFRDNFIKLAKALQDQMKNNKKTLQDILGPQEDYRAIKCMELMIRVGEKIGDVELVNVCKDGLELHLNTKKKNENDPHDIEDRFVQKHRQHFPRALREIKNGQKESCWIWFLIPTQPYFRDGVLKGSIMNRTYALYGDDAVRAYIKHNNGMLRDNYVELIGAIYEQMKKKKRTLRNLLGVLDDVKCVQSMELFARIGEELGDEEMVKICKKTLDIHHKQMKKFNKKNANIYKTLHNGAFEINNNNNKNLKKSLLDKLRFKSNKEKSKEPEWEPVSRRTFHGL